MVDRWMTKARDQRSAELPKAATRGTIVVGTSSGGFPFAAVQDNELAGFDIELRQAGTAIRRRRDPASSDQDFAAHIAALVSGKIDVILASMFDTEERRKAHRFLRALFRAGLLRLYRQGEHGGGRRGRQPARRSRAGRPSSTEWRRASAATSSSRNAISSSGTA
jgi:hypothetical protein